jgi:hypothetical protein
MVSGQPTRQEFVAPPHLPARVVGVNRLDDFAHGARNNTHALKLSLLEQLRLGPGQPAKVWDGNVELSRRGRNVAIILGQHAQRRRPEP